MKMTRRSLWQQRLSVPMLAVRRYLASSYLLSTLSALPARVDRALGCGILGRIGEGVENTTRRVRAVLTRTEEESLLWRLRRAILSYLASLTLESLGWLGLWYGAFVTVMAFFDPTGERHLTELLPYLGLSVLSVPLLRRTRPILSELRAGFLTRRWRVGEGVTVQKTHDGRWLGLLLAFLLAVGGIWIAPRRLWLALVGTGTFALLVARPELGVGALLALLPFFELLPHPTLSLCSLSGAVLLSWLRRALRGRRAASFDATDLPVLLLALLFLWNGLFSAGGKASAAEGIARALLVLSWFPARNLLEDVRRRNAVLSAARASAVAVALIGVWQYLQPGLTLRFTDVSRFSAIGGRVTSVFSNPNFLAVYLVALLPFFFCALADRERAGLARFCDLVGLLCVLSALLLTWTRGAWLGAAAQTLLFLLLYSPASAAGLVLAIPAALPLSSLLPQAVRLRFSGIIRPDSSVHYRFFTWRGVQKLLAEHPGGVGVGEAAFRAVYPRYSLSGIERVMHAHRLDLQLLLEHGSVGIVIFLAFLLLFWTRAWRHGQRERGVPLAASLSVLGYLVMGGFDYVWYHFGNFALFFLLAACGVVRDAHGEGEGWNG